MNFTWILLVVIAAIAVTGLANRRNLQAPLVLVAVGSAASFLPGMPRPELDPHVILSVVLPPLLYSAALKFSVATFKRNLAPILRLGVGMVLVTAFAVGFFAEWMVPEFTIGAALVLGAVIAPTDAVSAVAVGQKLGLPKRVIAILTGEGLVNDATALTLFTVAVSAVAGTRIVTDSPLLFFAYEVVGGVVIGLVMAFVVKFVRSRMYDSPLETGLGLVLPFAAYLAAEELHASGVLAVVVAGLVIGHYSTDASIMTRLQERSVWSSLETLLEMFVFAYMGLQLSFVIDDVVSNGLPFLHVLGYGFAVLGVVIVIRPVWLFLSYSRVRFGVTFRRGLRQKQLSWKQNVVVSWAGMRGVVTLAAAGGIPFTVANGDPFPGRGVIQAIAFVVAVGTLLIQGATLPFIIRRLDVADPYEVLRDREQMELARNISRQAGEKALADASKNLPAGIDRAELHDVMDRVRRSMQARLQLQEADDDSDRQVVQRKAGALFDKFRHQSLRAQRVALIAARDDGDLDDEVLRTVLEGLDIEEAAAEERLRRRRARSADDADTGK
ncbi:Na+/H+ antiporter [Rhodococcus sp. 27YEA15]|uniref:Na+/H+ antiporter n=1 Tax=Rhodococcus sp. 27YEA15 TaxID=3156259 RepID=UPI003C7D2F9C